MTYPVKAPKKLIEVALPLDAINVAAAREKSIRHGHPSTLHLWWARRPLAAARAVIFAQLVNDDRFVEFLHRRDRRRVRAHRCPSVAGVLEPAGDHDGRVGQQPHVALGQAPLRQARACDDEVLRSTVVADRAPRLAAGPGRVLVAPGS